MIVPILLAILLGYFIFDIARKRAKLPPGPIPLPLLGNLHQFYWKTVRYGCIVKAMESFRQEYGPVFTLWLGYQPTVHIGSMDIAQETMVKRGGEYVDRWMPLLMKVEQSPFGITANSGPIWQTQRRFSLHTLRNFGFGKNVMEERIMAELNYRTDKLDSTLKNGKGIVHVRQFINLIVGSIINRVLLSYRFEEEDEKVFFQNKGLIDKFGDIYTPTDFLMTRFWMMAIPFFKKRWGFLGNSTLELRDFFKKQIMTRVAQIKSGEHVIDEEPADYVDAFLQKVEEEKEKSDSSFNLESLVMNIGDIWIAGQVTTTSTLMFGLAHLLHHPEVVTRVRKELQEVAKDRSLSQTDKLDTPYLVATINEIQRFASLLNINFFREQRGDNTVGGYPIASGTPVTAELNMLMMDEKYFKNPREFYPDRFIEDPKLEQQVVPFGMGKRICIGESLARMELYLILGNFILRYDFKPHGPLPNRDKTNSYAVFSMPHDFEMEVMKLQ